MPTSPALDLEDTVTAVYCALDDALKEAKVEYRNGKLTRRRGPVPDMDDREVLCLAVLQELLHFESDNRFFLWAANNRTMRALFPRMLTRQKFADRRALLTPLMQQLCQAFCVLGGEGQPPFLSSTHTPFTSASSCAPNAASGSMAWPRLGTAPR
jgi:hypothetical protein